MGFNSAFKGLIYFQISVAVCTESNTSRNLTQKHQDLIYFVQCPTNAQLLYALFLVIPRSLNFICRRFGTFCLFHLYRRIPIRLWRWNRQSVPKRRHTKFRRRGITQKKAYNIQNTAKVWNQEIHNYFTNYYNPTCFDSIVSSSGSL